MSNQAELYQRVSFGQHQCGLEMIEILSPQPGDNILDIGSGTGNLTFELAKCIQPTGFVYAVDPDEERVSVAKEEQPVDINNIIWHSESLEVFFKKESVIFDKAYSNCVFHWIENQKAAIKMVYDNLIPGGHFAFCCGFGMPKVIQDLCHAIGSDGDKIKESLHFIPKKQWLNYFQEAGFEIELIKEAPDYAFEDLEEVMTWWEATTHGVFAVNKLREKDRQDLEEKYSGNINIYSKETLRLLAVK